MKKISHIGFKAAEAAAAAGGARNPGAVIAAAARKASPAAKRANPRLLKVSGMRKARPKMLRGY
jgi:hypothetical protein